MKNLLKLAVPTIVAISATFATTANAFVVNFDADSSLGGINFSTGEADADALGSNLRLEVVNGTTAGTIDFIFRNNDSVYDSTINDLYFGSDPLFASVFDFVGFTAAFGQVAFSEGANPSAPPGMQSFASFAADSDSPVMQNGIGAGEMLTVTFDNISDPEWTLAQIESAFATGELAVIIHVQSIDGDQLGISQWYSTNPPTDAAEPSSLALLALGLAGVGFSRRLARK